MLLLLLATGGGADLCGLPPQQQESLASVELLLVIPPSWGQDFMDAGKSGGLLRAAVCLSRSLTLFLFLHLNRSLAFLLGLLLLLC